jgi:hypothetical protein
MDILNFKNFKIGDLVQYNGGGKEKNEEKFGLVLSINPILGSGFQTADVLWCDDSTTETVVLTYLSLFSTIACKKDSFLIK